MAQITKAVTNIDGRETRKENSHFYYIQASKWHLFNALFSFVRNSLWMKKKKLNLFVVRYLLASQHHFYYFLCTLLHCRDWIFRNYTFILSCHEDSYLCLIMRGLMWDLKARRKAGTILQAASGNTQTPEDMRFCCTGRCSPGSQPLRVCRQQHCANIFW